MLRLVDQPPSFDPAPELRAGPSAYGLTPDELAALGAGRRAAHRFAALQRPWTWSAEGPALGRAARGELSGHSLELPEVVEEVRSSDGSARSVFQTADGHRIEAVHMPRATRSPRVTLCLSSQVGCAMGCTFCATGQMGIRRNLTAGEIVGQALSLLSRHGPRSGHEVNVVFMGMGEPLHNFDHVTKAIAVLCDPRGLGVPERRVTVSTSGLVTGIDKLAQASPRPLLALSVNATTDAARSRTMPVTRAWGLSALKAALLRWPLRAKERLTLEYVLLSGENDSEDDAERLAAFADGLSCHVNVIPLNEHDGTGSRRPSDEAVREFCDRLHARGVLCFPRFSKGGDVRAACGQLVQPLREAGR